MRTFILTLLILILINYNTNYSAEYHPPHFEPYNGLKIWKERIFLLESNNNHLAVGLNHYRGLAQIGRQAAMDANVHYDSLFIPRWNDTATVRLARNNWRYLSDCIGYINDTINGIKITKAGILAAAHLKGHSYVRAYLKTKGRINGKDANGVSVEDRLRVMQDIYEINL